MLYKNYLLNSIVIKCMFYMTVDIDRNGNLQPWAQRNEITFLLWANDK